MEITASPQLPAPEAIHTLIVYEVKTGVIVHRHHVVTFPGAPRRTRQELVARAIEMARAQTGVTKGLDVLHTDWQAFTEPAEYRVDPRSKQLVLKRRSPAGAVPKGARKGRRVR
jgi:hypothetical protein